MGIGIAMSATQIDLGYQPRPHQVQLHHAIDGHRWTVAVAHRRFGKTVASIVHLIMAALQDTRERPRYALIAPTYRQAKLIAWDYLKAYSAHIPGVEQRESDLIINFPTGARVQLLGADNPDSIRGTRFDGVVFDEYGMQPPNVFAEIVRPALADREGWAVFLGTPNGHNHFYEVAERAKRGTDGWTFLEFKASVTGVLSEPELADARTLMTADEYQQEFECSFTASVRGAIYGSELEAARVEGRIGVVSVEPMLPVQTAWDLGVGDATAIWFFQRPRSGDVRLVDYYEASGEGLPHYAQVLQARGYPYGDHWAPHDIEVRELGTGRTRIEVAQALGIRFRTVPRLHGTTGGELEEGIHVARMLFARCWFDATRCAAGLEALAQYRREYNQRLNVFKATPVHDVYSHGADAFRYLAVAQQQGAAPARTPTGVPRWTQTADSWMGL